ncbi:hypothetical protein H6F43_16020 [Leptolyngbya sp. FACHB-36]|uniref:hypothetical protein n=1 Tax=Leptolyngbya sp. FACHB-36 TaxID=2692808 RepID=UPI001681055B|nr:hypothetical protein [Leptolyngbya sp. FACHB-36]MBD2021687.1 hypothetical protein [Leptolyngbya sp. FACHB-36]
MSRTVKSTSPTLPNTQRILLSPAVPEEFSLDQSKVGGIRLQLLSTDRNSIRGIAAAEALHCELCDCFDPQLRWVPLPAQLQQQINAGGWGEAIACLRVKGLVSVTVEG